MVSLTFSVTHYHRLESSWLLNGVEYFPIAIAGDSTWDCEGKPYPGSYGLVSGRVHHVCYRYLCPVPVLSPPNRIIETNSLELCCFFLACIYMCTYLLKCWDAITGGRWWLDCYLVWGQEFPYNTSTRDGSSSSFDPFIIHGSSGLHEDPPFYSTTSMQQVYFSVPHMLSDFDCSYLDAEREG